MWSLLGTEFVVPFSLSLSSHLLSENFIIWVKTLPYFTQMMIFSPNTSFWTKKMCHLMFHDDLRAREQEREEKGTTNFAPKLPLYTHSCRFLFFLSKKVRLMIYTWFWGWVVMPGYTKLIWRTRSANILLFKIFRYTWQCSKTFFSYLLK